MNDILPIQNEDNSIDPLVKENRLLTRRKLEDLQYLKTMKRTYFADLDDMGNLQEKKRYQSLLEELYPAEEK